MNDQYIYLQNRKNKEVKDLPFILSAPLNISDGET